MQSLLQGLPLAAQQYSYAQPSSLTNILKGSTAVQGLGESILGTGGIGGLISGLFGGGDSSTTQGATGAGQGYNLSGYA